MSKQHAIPMARPVMFIKEYPLCFLIFLNMTFR
jgi:hypothetical protein